MCLCGNNSQGLLQLSQSSQISLHFLTVSILIIILQDNSQARHTEFSHGCKFTLSETEPEWSSHVCNLQGRGKKKKKSR